MRFSKVISGEAHSHYRYVEHEGVLFKVLIGEVAAQVWPLGAEEMHITAVLVNGHHSYDPPRATLECVPYEGYDGEMMTVIDMSIKGMKVAVELLRSGWKTGQLEAIRRFATETDVEKQAAKILVALEQI